MDNYGGFHGKWYAKLGLFVPKKTSISRVCVCVQEYHRNVAWMFFCALVGRKREEVCQLGPSDQI